MRLDVFEKSVGATDMEVVSKLSVIDVSVIYRCAIKALEFRVLLSQIACPCKYEYIERCA